VGTTCDRHRPGRPNRCSPVQPPDHDALLTGAPRWHRSPTARASSAASSLPKNDPVALPPHYGYTTRASHNRTTRRHTVACWIIPSDPRCTNGWWTTPPNVSLGEHPWPPMRWKSTTFCRLAPSSTSRLQRARRTTRPTTTLPTVEFREKRNSSRCRSDHQRSMAQGYISARPAGRASTCQPPPRASF